MRLASSTFAQSRAAWVVLAVLAALPILSAQAAQADPLATLQSFVRDVKTGRARFVQTVSSPDGAKKKVSSGSFEFARPNRFRFAYTKPFEQTIVADGQKVWIYDADLNQASSRPLAAAIGATPAALLAGGSLEKDFELAALPSENGVDWVGATPKARDSAFKTLRIGFRGSELAAIEIVDAFDQRSMLVFSQFAPGAVIPPETFRFKPPAGADVIEQ